MKHSSAPSDVPLRYDCDLEKLPGPLAERFVELDSDEVTRTYLKAAARERHGQLFTLTQNLLCYVLSDFDANALLGAYPMHLLSVTQWRKLLGSHPGGRLLDIGAGSGDVTIHLAPLFDETVTTETSRAMAWRLRRRGFVCHRLDMITQQPPDPPYDTISCLNVLDRCARPLSLLRQLHATLAANGRLVLSLPLPYSPFVYDGPRVERPSEQLPLDESSWEAGAASLVDQVLAPLALELESLSRAPYLSGGDARQPLYVLDAAIVVCRK